MTIESAKVLVDRIGVAIETQDTQGITSEDLAKLVTYVSRRAARWNFPRPIGVLHHPQRRGLVLSSDQQRLLASYVDLISQAEKVEAEKSRLEIRIPEKSVKFKPKTKKI